MNIFRHKKSDLFLCLSFLLTFLICVLLVGELDRVQGENDCAEYRSYRRKIGIAYNPSTEVKVDIDRITAALEGQNGLVWLTGVALGVDSTGMEWSGNIFLWGTEAYKYVADGDKAASFLPDSAAIIGSGLEDCLTEDGKLSVDGTLFPAGAVDYEKWTEDYENFLMLPYGLCSSYTKSKLSDALMLNFVIASDTGDAEAIYGIISELLREEDPDAYMFRNNLNFGETDSGTESSVLIYVLSYLYCIINCIIAGEFYLSERRKEFAVCLAVGYTAAGLWKRVFGELLKLAAVAAIPCLLILLILSGTGSLTNPGKGVLSCLGIMAGTVVLCLISVMLRTGFRTVGSQLTKRD